MTYQERAANARQHKHAMVLEWFDRYGLLLTQILLDDTISVIEKVKRLEEYHIPNPVSQSLRWSRPNVYRWIENLPELIRNNPQQ